jgi:hypothetical protein
MTRSSIPKRRTLHASLPLFDGFPYLSVRVAGAMRHLTLLPADRPHAWLEDLARRQAGFNRLDVALVLAPERAIVYAARADTSTEGLALCGGLLVSDRLLPAERFPATEELAKRSARLAAYLGETQANVGYVLGDITKGGRPATLEERVRLEGIQPNGTLRGLVPCGVCSEWAGTCVDPSDGFEGLVVEVHCRCANDHHCAWCGRRLAPYRLNGNFYDPRRREIWHVPGFEALGHRCSHATRWEEAPPGHPPTAEEQAILDMIARSEGRGWVERHTHLILEQARAIGDL